MVVYSKKKRHPTRNLQAVVKHLEEPEAVEKKLEKPNAVVKQLTDNDGLGRAYDAANGISIINNTLYISGTIGRTSDWYVDITKVTTFGDRCFYSQCVQVLHVCSDGCSTHRRFSKEG